MKALIQGTRVYGTKIYRYKQTKIEAKFWEINARITEKKDKNST